VQLESGGGGLRGKLIAASCALLGSAPVARAQTHDVGDTINRALAEIDFGGIGKEYAVDRAYDFIRAQCPVPFLVNFGGDLRVSRPLAHGPWKVGIERPDSDCQAARMLEIEQGGLATSGDSHRFLLKEGVRYGHILDPRTGWPVPNAPRSVTVAASSCTEAGLLSTLAVLHGKDAEEFLEQQAVRSRVFR
jgi:thiamine biosynthesis lipoprotein